MSDAQCTAFAGALVRRQRSGGPRVPKELLKPGQDSCFPPASEFLPGLHHGHAMSALASMP